jgi:hypothetical protein
MQTITLTSEQVLSHLKSDLQRVQREFVKNPNACQWHLQTLYAFVYQQGYYYLHSGTRTHTEKAQLLETLSKTPLGNWPEAICQAALGVSIKDALREHANCP